MKNTNASSFLHVYRNKFLRDKVFSHLGQRYRVHDNLFRNGVVFHQYDDLQLSDIINTGNIYLINEKLKQFEYYQDTDTKDNHKLDDKQLKKNFKESYKCWLDFNFQESLENLSRLKEKISDDQMDTLLIEILKVFNIRDHEIKMLSHVLLHFSVSERNLSIFKKSFDRIDICKYEFRDINILKQVFKQDIALVSDYNKLINLSLFLENKQIFRDLMKNWSDHGCIQALLHRDKLDLDVLVWVLQTSPSINYKLFIQNLPKRDQGKYPKYTLFNVDIVVREDPFFALFPLSLKHIELLEFAIRHYKLAFNSFVTNNNQIKLIDDVKVASRFIEYTQAFPNKDQRVIVTKSSDIQLFKLIIDNGFELRGTNLFSSVENVLFFLENQPTRFNSLSKIHPSNVQFTLDALEINGNQQILSIIGSKIPTDLCNIDIIKKYKEPFSSWRIIVQNAVNQYLQFGNLDLYRFLIQESRLMNLDHLCFIMVAMKKYDLDAVVSFIEPIKEYFFQKYIDLFIIYTIPYWFLALAKTEDEKRKARNIIDYFFNKEVFLKNVTFSNSFNILQDPAAFKKIGFFHSKSKIDLVKSSLLTGDLALTKNIIAIMEQDEYNDFLSKLETIVIAYFNISPTTAFKVPLYLFSTFPTQFSRETLANLASIATKNLNFLLLDILLHRTKLRLLEPRSKEHDQELLEFSWMNIHKSKYYAKCSNYDFSKNKIIIPDKRLNLHLFNDFDETTIPRSHFYSYSKAPVVPLPQESVSVFISDLINKKKDVLFKV
ncbi:hypothetical protein CYY_009333 [Polysphondylium violaceum]|uniref:Uncharacterized protein n=1 Tax=Polysphondylium violaceum TaxID=133409 RepID=A0A8J4PN01_9MYCE|nr:hypothetical protein CYY_009333 [Polysphondylium violaceum]